MPVNALQFIHHRLARHWALPVLGVLALLAQPSPNPAHAAEGLTPERVKSAVVACVRQELAPHLQSLGDDVRAEIDVLQMPQTALSMTADEPVSIHVESNLQKTYSERTVAHVTLTTASGLTRQFGVPVKLTIQKPVWVVKNYVNAKTPLTASNFSLQLRDVSHQLAFMAGREINLGDYVARTNLQPGEILDRRKIAIPPDIIQNSEITILLTNGNGMTVAITGIALSDGKIGESIRVRQTAYNTKYYTAKVVDKNRVMVLI